jgi:hypothetical protein
MTREADEIADRFVEELAAADPVTATFAGIAGHEDRLPDLTPEGFEGRAELLRSARAEMERATPCDEREAVARSSFLERAEAELALLDAHASTSSTAWPTTSAAPST